MKKSILAIGFLAVAAVLYSCGGNSNSNATPAATDSKPATEQSADAKSDAPKADTTAPATTTQAVDFSKKYVCPNRDGSSDQPGVCEACGMDLIEN